VDGDAALPRGEALETLERLYADLERKTRLLDAVHGERLLCGRGCSACCRDGLTVFDVEAANIRRRGAALLASGAPGPEGACAFLGRDGECRIYDARPYVCRTQGYPLRWVEEAEGGGLVEWRDVCPRNEPGTPVESLPEDACWTLGPFEEDLSDLETRASGGKRTRVALRSLFARTA
jgi:Fe-S-cluster containining protein